jgi:hypothetical protein
MQGQDGEVSPGALSTRKPSARENLRLSLLLKGGQVDSHVSTGPVPDISHVHCRLDDMGARQDKIVTYKEAGSDFGITGIENPNCPWGAIVAPHCLMPPLLAQNETP